MNAKEIQDIRFSKSMSGYKTDEVDDFCDKVFADYVKFAELVKTQQETIAKLEEKIRDTETSAESINTVLISAQKLADSIVAEAKEKAELTVENANNEAENIKLRTKKALEEIDAVITEQKKQAEKEAEEILKEAARKSEGMILAAKDSVAREQLLFDKLRSEVAAFKKEIKNAYKAHLESLSALPEEVPVNPEQASIKIEEIINNEPDLRQFIEKQESPLVVEPEVEDVIEVDLTVEDGDDDIKIAPETPISEPLKEVMSDMSAGFIVTPIGDDE